MPGAGSRQRQLHRDLARIEQRCPLAVAGSAESVGQQHLPLGDVGGQALIRRQLGQRSGRHQRGGPRHGVDVIGTDERARGKVVRDDQDLRGRSPLTSRAVGGVDPAGHERSHHDRCQHGEGSCPQCPTDRSRRPAGRTAGERGDAPGASVAGWPRHVAGAATSPGRAHDPGGLVELVGHVSPRGRGRPRWRGRARGKSVAARRGCSVGTPALSRTGSQG